MFDSRGRSLEYMVGKANKTDIIIEPWLFEGATIEDLAREAEYYAGMAPFDQIFIAGGICNVTTKNKLTKKIEFNWSDSIDLATHLVNTMDKAEDFLFKSRPATNFIFCPLLGADLSSALKKPSLAEQSILDEAIWIFNDEIHQRNSMKKMYAPNFADPVYRKIRGSKRTFLHHLHEDGIHLSNELKEIWVRKILKLTVRN